MWKDERPIPESGVQEPAFYYLPKTGIWRYDDVEAGDTDYLVAKWPLTSWEE